MWLMQELLLQVWEQHHQTVLFITHDIEEALLLADRVCVMTARPGRIKKNIDVRIPRPRAIEVTTSPKFNALRREVLALIPRGKVSKRRCTRRAAELKSCGNRTLSLPIIGVT
jgi:ABC-type nitrate/sulfonate/bicarbonate transport system ATPase subunit